MSEQEGPVTAYTWQISAQDQQGGPGLDKDMKEQANWTQLEYWDDNGKPYLKEYEGRGLLQDKAVLITGGDSGIGRSVAILMAREGADVSILYLPEEEEDAQYTIKQIEKAGRKGHGMQYDLKEEANCKAAIDEHIKVFGKLNVLVNNASMQESCEDHREIDISTVTKTFQTNIIQVCHGFVHRHVTHTNSMPTDDGLEQVRPPTHETRRQHRQLGLRPRIHGRPIKD